MQHDKYMCCIDREAYYDWSGLNNLPCRYFYTSLNLEYMSAKYKLFFLIFKLSHSDRSTSVRNFPVESYKSTNLQKLSLDNHFTSVCESNCFKVSFFFYIIERSLLLRGWD